MRPSGTGRNADMDYHGERRSNETLSRLLSWKHLALRKATGSRRSPAHHHRRPLLPRPVKSALSELLSFRPPAATRE